jgi:GntR family transcriptional regulator
MNRIRLDNTHIPLHYQIADYLEGMLKRGEMAQDVQVPPEEELTEAFGVSRTTVRRSLEHLLVKGLLTRTRGKGTFWTDSAKEIKREKLFGVNKQIFNISEKTSVRVLSKLTGKGNSIVCAFLGTPDDSDLVIFRRVRFSAGSPMSYTINYMPEKYGARIEKKHLQQMTMLETIEKIAGVQIGTIEHEVEITRATDVIAECLDIPVLDPVLTIKTSVYGKNGSPVEVVWTYFVENKYKFRVVLD